MVSPADNSALDQLLKFRWEFNAYNNASFTNSILTASLRDAGDLTQYSNFFAVSVSEPAGRPRRSQRKSQNRPNAFNALPQNGAISPPA